jgi:purine-nucleoside phosphorylase
MSTVYPSELRTRAQAAAGTSLKEGVYAWFTGPADETPAEVEMARRPGADLVSMSTVPEAVAARHIRQWVGARSCATLGAVLTSRQTLPDRVQISRRRVERGADRSR